MEIRPIAERELGPAAALAAEQQADATRHVCYLGMGPDDIAAELRALEPHGLEGVLVAVDGERLLGLLGTEYDTDPPRAWWWGPFVFDHGEHADAVADALLAQARRLLPAEVTQEELGPDDRNAFVAALARRHGFTAETASAVLTRTTRDLVAGAETRAEVSRLREDDRDAVAALHDTAFPGTHVPGRRVDEGERRVVLVARLDGRPTGYVAAEAQQDGSGYIDYLAVDPAARGHGVGAALVRAASAALLADHGCATVNLTVRESNIAARRLYAGLGFTEERLIRPWRRGFSLEAGGAD